ncbi:MAG: (Fe-S)-binding protein [Rhodoferax sp.]|uniref:(Fe-S)-binding protein n=1 Tax=Rhodoferax sp. TaxID=50421 RepID=UPI00272F0331|nr:(Fe-S)-binding protein [Rhodoferax sp.]MDP1527783.1 (Fe-S)-binding protein [Rhodoferax sp.]MDP1942483.1 (Fe-S)-binding protein [Rhodoferax sp.]
MPTTSKPRTAFDQQGEQSDAARVDAALHSFVSEFGVTAALHMESCVRCGLCAQACHFYLATGDAKYTPIRKLELFRRSYLREASPFAPLVRALGLVKKPGIADLQQWQELLYDSCTLCGRCTLACPMGIDMAELVKVARHGMFKAGLVPDRLALMDRAARQWGSTATPGEDLPDILAEAGKAHGVEIPCDLAHADILVTAAPAELGDNTKALADAAKILNHIGASWTMHQGGFDASNIGFNNGDLELQEQLTRALIDTAVKIGASTVLLPECGHAYGAARWEAAKWYGQALPVRVIHMTEFLDELVSTQRIRLRQIGDTATFHDPCQIVRRGGLEAAARRVLAALGVELIELQDHGVTAFCCGGGGGVVSNQRAAPLRQKVFEIKRQQVDATGAERFITSCGQCLITLEMGAKNAQWDKRAESLLALVADNLAD